MLDIFIAWAQQFAGKSWGKGIEVRVAEARSSSNPSARLDIDTPKTVARITCWENGDYDAEVIDAESEQRLFSTHGGLQEGQALSKQFAAFFKSQGIAGE